MSLRILVSRAEMSYVSHRPRVTSHRWCWSTCFRICASRRLAARREVDELRQEFSSHLFWRVEEGVLSDGSARYVMHIPYFQLEGGVSFAFLRPGMNDKKQLAIRRFLNATHYLPSGGMEEAWKGMAVGHGEWTNSRHSYGDAQSVFGSSFLRIN